MECISPAFWRWWVWGKNGKWAGGMTRSKKWQNMWLYTSIYPTHYNSGWPLGNNDTQASPIIRLVSLHLTTSMIQFSKPPHINHLHQVYAYLNCLGFLSCVWLPHHSYPSSLQLWWFFSLGFNLWWRVVETFQFEGWLYYDKNYHIIFYPIFPL